MEYKAIDIANYILNYDVRMNYYCNYLKLQNLLYFVQARLLCNSDSFFNDDIIASGSGVYIKDVHNSYAVYTLYNVPGNREHSYIYDNDIKLINDMVDYCSSYSCSEMAKIVQSQTPWFKAYNYGRYSSRIISRDSIYNYFSDDKKIKKKNF